MKTMILQFLVLFSTVSLGRSLICLQCVSPSSWSDCVLNGQEQQCLDSLSNCAKIQIGEAFGAGCVTPKHCKEACEGQDDCDIECCSKDLCNIIGGSAPEPEKRKFEDADDIPTPPFDCEDQYCYDDCVYYYALPPDSCLETCC